MSKKIIFIVSTALLSVVGCTHAPQEQQTVKVNPEADNSSYVASIDGWHKEREENLRKEDSWLALAGLFWLNEGENSFGSAESNDLVFPQNKIADHAGAFVLEGDKVMLQLSDGADVKLNGEPVKQNAVVYSPEMEQAFLMAHGPLKWVVIKRGDKYAVRLWDAESKARKTFTGIERYPVKQEWKLDARLEQNPLPKQIAITNVLGQTSQEPSPGAVVFTIKGKEYRLDALEEGEELFIIFADRTNGTETYGSGRYLYMPKPGADGRTVIDFNKAYNPPCVFTGFATCPLPPKQNFLPIKVTAGEKTYEIVH